jgi:CRISPR/Cas system-associated exonuclease Cas4 (RecB family)
MDERENKMSGSAMATYAECAGKFQLEITCPPSEGGAAADMGTRIHAYLAGEDVTLNDEEQAIADRCQEEYAEILETLDFGAPDHVTVEKRLWYGDIWSGQIDLILHWGDKVLIIDWKTGRVGTGNTAADNLQLRAYAVLVKKNLPNIREAYVAIVQPMAQKYTIAHYDIIDLIAAEHQIQGIVEAAMHPDAPRTPTPSACKYCSAKAICPEAGGVASELAVFTPAQVPALSNEAIADFLDKADVVEAFIEAIRDEAKKRLLEGHEIAGRKLASGRTSRSVEDPVEAFKALEQHLTPNEFTSACKVSIPQLEKIFAASNDMKPAEAKAALGKLLEDVLVTKTGSAMMVRCKKEDK